MNSTDTNSLTQAESNANTLLLLRSVIDSSLDSIQVFNSVKDATGKIIDFVWLLQNQKSQEQNGDVIGMSLIKKQPEVIPAGIFDKLRQVTESGQSQELEQYFPTKQFSGDWFYMGMVRQGDGVMMTIRNITVQKIAENEILALKDQLAKKTTARYLKLFNSIDEGFCIIEVKFDEKDMPNNWTFLEVNSAFEKNNGPL